ncbi:MAG TPA: hypothetical protein VM597_15980, partial [Gemmataceae bacterium]|nr:hypothetical protein [Gemmataceae bacterium]
MRARWLPLLAVALGQAGPVAAETYSLAEANPQGTVHRISIETTATGTLQVARGGKPTPIKVDAKNAHTLVEKVVATDRVGIRRAVRWYETAVARATVDGDRNDRTLAADHRLILAQRVGDDLGCYALAGPLTRSELEVVAEHFDTLHLAGVLPPKPAAVGDAWKVGNGPAQSLCLFQGLIANELTAKLAAVNG